MHKAAKAYLTTKVTTTSQGDILIMLYDAAIKNLKQAKVRIDEKNYAAKGILISKAMDIIAELSESLNAEKGGDLAENLHNIYFYCSTKLLTANLKMDTGLLDEVIKILTGIRSAFAEIIPGHSPNPEEGKASAPHAAAPTIPGTVPGVVPGTQGFSPATPKQAAAPGNGQAAPSSPRPLIPTAAPPMAPPAMDPQAGAGQAPSAPRSQAAAPQAAQSSTPKPAPAAPAKKPAPVTPLHPMGQAPSGPVRRAVAAYGNAR